VVALKSVEKVYVLLKSDKIKGTVHACRCYLRRLPRLLWLLANLGIMVVMVTNVTIGFLVAMFT
jgi:hypothetical protein